MSGKDKFDNENEQRITEEFLEELKDTVSGLQVLLGNLRSGAVKAGEGLTALRQSVASLNSQAHGHNLPTIKLLTHRLDDYVSVLKEVNDTVCDELQVYFDKLESVADGEEILEADIPGIVRALPAKRHELEAEFGSIEQKDIEVLLVIPEKAMSRIVDRELAACGYRVSVVRDPFVAIENAVRTKPDMVIAAMELGVLSGVDLASAFSAMPITENIPFAVLTSYDWGHPKLQRMPPRVALIHKGSKFGDDLAETLSRFRIT